MVDILPFCVMDRLNYDCFLHIIKYLTISQILVLRKISIKVRKMVSEYLQNVQSLSILGSSSILYNKSLKYQLYPDQPNCYFYNDYHQYIPKDNKLIFNFLPSANELEEILSYFPSLKVLMIDCFNRRMIKQWKVLSRIRLTHLNIINCPSIDGLSHGTVKHLELHCCFIDEIDEYKKIPINLPYLEVLIIQNNPKNDCSFNYIPLDITSLGLLGYLTNNILYDVCHYKRLHSLQLSQIRSNQLLIICEQLKYLKRLEFNANIIELSPISKLKYLESLAFSCTKSKSLDLNSNLLQFNCPLKYLSIKCLMINNETLHIIYIKWPILQCLRLFNGKINSINTIKKMKKLKIFEIDPEIDCNELPNNKTNNLIYIKNGIHVNCNLSLTESIDDNDDKLKNHLWIKPLPKLIEMILWNDLNTNDDNNEDDYNG